MNTKLSLLVATLLALNVVFIARPSEAALIWNWDFTNSGGTYASTDNVTLLARLTNNSTNGETIGDMSLADYFVNIGGEHLVTQSVLNYSFAFFPTNNTFYDQFNALALTPGNSFDFTFGTFTAPGGGVPTGDYEITGDLGLVVDPLTDDTPDPDDSPLILRDKHFLWKVSDGTDETPGSNTVPEPMTLSLLGMGLVGGTLLRKKRN